MSDEVYLRIYLDSNNKISIVSMQYFDEPGYDQNRFLSKILFNSEDKITVFLKSVNLNNVPSYIRDAVIEYLSNSGIKNILDI